MVENVNAKDKPIKDLTGRPNKRLTPAQRQAKQQSKTGGYTDVNYDGVPDRDQVDFGRLSSDMRWVSNIIEAHPALKGIFEDHVRKGSFDPESGQQGISNFQNDIMDSSWWKDNNQYARAAFALKTTSPADYADAIEDATRSLRDSAKAKGITVTDEQLALSAETYVTDGWGEPGRSYKIDDALNEFMKTSTKGKPSGDLRSYANSLRNIATANGLQMSDQFYNDEAQSIMLGLTEEDDALMNIREQAAGLWPPYADKIRGGQNVRDLASGYIYSMANELEIDAQSISLNDNYIYKALTNVNDKGDSAPQSLWQFQQELRKDPRWINTNKAQNTMASTTTKVMQMFGLVG